MTTKKLTKKDFFMELKNLVNDRKDLVDFIDHEIELLEKRSTSKTLTKVQVENESIKTEIVELLKNSDKPLTIHDMQDMNENLPASNQKMSALLTQLVNAKIIIRTQDKKKVFFAFNREVV